MSNPLSIFRRHQRTLIAVFGVFIVLVFVVGGSLDKMFSGRGGSGYGKDVVVTWKGGSLTEQQLDLMKRRHGLAMEFVERVATATRKRKGSPKVPVLTPARTEQALLSRILLANEAERLGVVVGDKAVLDYLERLSDEVLSDDEFAQILQETDRAATEDVLFDQLKRELLARNMEEMAQSGLRGSTPAATWDYFVRLNRQAVAEIYPLKAEDFVSKVSATPSETQIKELFEKHKEQYPNPGSPDPGFRIRSKIAFQYFKAEFEKFLNDELKNITEEAIQAEYEDRVGKGQYKTTEPPPGDDKPETDKPETDKPETDKPDTDKPDTDKPDTDKPESDNPESDNPETDKPETDKPDTDKPDTDKPETDKPETDKPETDKPTDSPKPEGQCQEESKPADTKPGDTKPADTKPADAKPADTKPADTKPANTKPADTKPANTKPADTKPADTKPADTKPADTKPADTKPADAKPADAKPADAKPADTKPADAKPADTKPADAKPADAKPADAKPADSKPTGTEPADTKPAGTEPADTKPKAPVERIKTLDEVRDEIARALARPNAQAKMDAGVKAVKRVVREYGTALTRYRAAKIDNDDAVAPPEPDFEQLAADHGFGLGQTRLNDALEISENTEIGKAMTFSFANNNFQQITFAQLAYGEGVPLYQPADIGGQLSDTTFVYWRTKIEPERVPELNEVKDEVVKAWKRQKAFTAAMEAAEALKTTADAAAGKPLAESLGENAAEKVHRPMPFSWLTAGAANRFGGDQGLPRLGTVQYFTKDDEGKEENQRIMAGQDFMKAVFDLKPGEVGLAFDQPKNIVYVVRVESHFPSDDALRTRFMTTGPANNEYFMARIDQQQVIENWYQDLIAELDVNWLRDPQ